MTGNVREALLLAKQVIKLAPDHQRLLVNIQNYEEILKEQEGIRNYGETGRSELLNFSFRRTGLALDV